jgi:hypothetical protein
MMDISTPNNGTPVWTISDHVREMHAGGVGVEQICWKLKLRRGTVERWISSIPALAAKGTG